MNTLSKFKARQKESKENVSKKFFTLKDFIEESKLLSLVDLDFLFFFLHKDAGVEALVDKVFDLTLRLRYFTFLDTSKIIMIILI